MQHAFALRADPPSSVEDANAPSAPWRGRDVLLIALCLPAVLLAMWLCCIQHNWHRGAAAIRHALGADREPGCPVLLAGSAAGLAIVLGIALPGGTAILVEVLSQRCVWMIILLPEAAWAVPRLLAWVLLPLRGARWTGITQVRRYRSAFE